MAGAVGGRGPSGHAGLHQGFTGLHDQHQAQVFTGLSVARVGCEGHAQGIVGEVKVALLNVFRGQVVPGFGQLRVQRGHGAVDLDGFRVAIQRSQCTCFKEQ